MKFNEIHQRNGLGAIIREQFQFKNLSNKERWFYIVINLQKHDILYYARIFKKLDVYDVVELSVRTVRDTWFVGVEKRTEHAYTFSTDLIGKTVFQNREDALEVVKEAEKHRIKVNNERYYEEY